MMRADVWAIDPTSRGFCRAFFAADGSLLDQGMVQVVPVTNASTLRRLEQMFVFGKPVLVILENWRGQGSRRRPRTRELLDEIEALCRRQGIEVEKIDPALARFTQAGSLYAGKSEVADRIIRRISALERIRPRPRRRDEGEDERHSLFDAIALGLTYFDRLQAESEAA